MKICVFPGTFDPFTNGHLDIVERAIRVFDRVIVAVSASSKKGCMFGLDKRVALAKAATSHLKNVTVEGFEGLLVDFLVAHDSTLIIRGLRTVADLEYEDALSTVYRVQNPDVETMFFLNTAHNAHVHGTIVRDLLRHGADVSPFVPSAVLKLL